MINSDCAFLTDGQGLKKAATGRQQVEKAAGKQGHLQKHLTLITPVGILAQPFVFECVLSIITVWGEGKAKQLRIVNRKWSTCALTASRKG
jgi:hypothetical protein